MDTATTPATEVIDMDAPNTVPVTRDVLHELAAVSAAILDKRDEKTRAAKRFNLAIKDLEKRQRELIDEVKSGGTQLAIHFGTTIATLKAEADSNVTEEDVDAAIDAAGAEIDNEGEPEEDGDFTDDEPEQAH